MELIDRNEVGAKIQAMYIRREMDYGGENEFCRGMRKALRIIEDAPTIEVQPDKGWVSVDDRLPEIKEHYRSELVMCYSPDGEHECLFDYYEMNGFGQGCFTTEKYFGITITHWQPLPEPPKEVENETD